MAKPQSLPTTSLVLHTTLLLTIVQTYYFHLSYSSRPTGGLGFSLKLIPRDHPESPLYPGNLTHVQQVERLVNFSKAREQYLRYSASNGSWGSVIEPENFIMGVFRDAFFYIVMMNFGNPLSTQYLLMDTGGSLLWTQCDPCIRCYRQSTPIYNSRASSSYWKLPCSHFLCNGGPEAPFQCVNHECIYSVSYGAGGPTKGIASVETFQFGLKFGTFIRLDGIVFGCSNDNAMFPLFEDTPISGVFGLSWSPESLVTQLADYIHGRFSYCMVPFDEGRPGPSSLTFGDAIPNAMNQVQTTRFVVPPVPNSHYFYLNLLDISVGQRRLGFPADTFRINQDGSGGMIIDSGAVTPFLNAENLPNGRNPYREVMGAFQSFYDFLRLTRKIVHGPQAFELCYQMPPGFNVFETMTYHFAGADYTVVGRYAHSIHTAEGYFCVAMGPGHGMSILGAWHQQSKRIVYDANVGLQFSDEICE